MSTQSDTRELVLAALDRVVDPCSVGRHVPAGLVEMGMVDSVEVVAGPDGRGEARIELQLTSPGCHFKVWFDERIQDEVSQVEGVDAISIAWSQRWDWDDSKMSDGLKERLRAKRVAERRARRGAHPVSARSREARQHG